MKNKIIITCSMFLSLISFSTVSISQVGPGVTVFAPLTDVAIGTNTTAISLLLNQIDASITNVKTSVSLGNKTSQKEQQTLSKALREQMNENALSKKNETLAYFTGYGTDGSGGQRAKDIQKQGCQSDRAERALVRATDYIREASNKSSEEIMAGGTNSEPSTALTAKRALFKAKYCTQSEIDNGLCANVIPCTPTQVDAGQCFPGGDHNVSKLMNNLNTPLKITTLKHFKDNIIWPSRGNMKYNGTTKGISRYLNGQALRSIATGGLSSVLDMNQPISSSVQAKLNDTLKQAAGDKDTNGWVKDKTKDSKTLSVNDLLKFDVVTRYGNAMWKQRMKGATVGVQLKEIGHLLSAMHNLAYEDHELLRQLVLINSAMLANQVNQNRSN